MTVLAFSVIVGIALIALIGALGLFLRRVLIQMEALEQHTHVVARFSPDTNNLIGQVANHLGAFSKSHDSLADIRSSTEELTEAFKRWRLDLDERLATILIHLDKQQPKLMPIPAPEAPRNAPSPLDSTDSVYRALKLMGDRVRAAEADRERAVSIAKALKERLDAQAKPLKPPPDPPVSYETVPTEEQATIEFEPIPDRTGMTSMFDEILKAAKPKDVEE